MIANLQEVIALVESAWRQARVVVVGDVMLDKYVWGEIERISPEAPVPVVQTVFADERPGGAANVAMNLSALGACVTVCGFGGGDREQERLEALLAEAGVEPQITAVVGVPTTTKVRVLSGNQQVLRIDTEVKWSSAAGHEELLKHALAVLPQACVLVLSDYAKGVLSDVVCRALIAEARKLHIPVLVDPKTVSFARYQGATTICPNRKELAAALAETSADLDKLLTLGREMLPALQVDSMAVTLGEKGIAVLQPGSRCHFPAVVRQVYDVSGAGDTVLAVLALALACGVDIEIAAQVANIAAGIVVSKVGTVPVRGMELLGALSKEGGLDADEKLVPLERLLARVAVWRSAGEQIVFTNGCFDLLHVGHISLLERARRLGDRLVVGLNTDSSVRRVKGQSRPVVSERDRGKVLAALSAVDAVVLFDQITPLALIEAIRPDVLVKGGDYTEEDVVGAREIRAWGGRVELIPLVDGVSTTRLIAKSVAQVSATGAMPAVAS